MKGTFAKDERAPKGAYAVGQTDLDGSIVVWSYDGYVVKEDRPWTGDTRNATE